MKKGWFAYAIFFTAAIIFGETANLAKGKEITILILVNWVFTISICIGIFSYSLQKKVFTQQLWKVVTLTFVALSLSLIPYFIFKSGTAFLVGFLILLPVVLPAYLAIYRYAYSSSNIWHT